MKKKPRPKATAAELEAVARFRKEVKGYCILCGEPGIDPHHLIRQQSLRAHTSTMDDTERWIVVHDPRNGVPLCRRCHERVTSRFRPILRSEVPPRAWKFAKEHGLTWLLERECPEDAEFLFGRDRAA
jgi:hypothetical protein